MQYFRFLIVFLFFNGVVGNIFSQYIRVDDSRTATNLVENVLINSGCANVSNIFVSGGNFGSNDNSFGFFDGNGSIFPFLNGVILSTGKVKSAPGPNDIIISDGLDIPWPGDPDLNNALNISGSLNATILEFDFVPLTTKISFDYIFASEQYLSDPSSSQCTYTDGFAFLLKEDGTNTYKNLALVPGTTTPVLVSTVRGSGTVCGSQNEQFFGGFNTVNYPTNFNGQTVPLKAESSVIAGKKYHIKLVIADQGNFRYDSAIFLSGGSFKVGVDLGTDRILLNNSALCSGENKILDATLASATNYKWFKDGIQILGENNPTYTISDNTNLLEIKYSVEVILTGTTCTVPGAIKIQFSQKPILKNVIVTQCDDDNDGLSVFDLTKLDDFIRSDSGNNPLLTSDEKVEYFTDPSLNNKISNTTSFQNTTTVSQLIYALVKNKFGCSDFATVNLLIGATSIADQSFDYCDDDAIQDGKTEINFDIELTNRLLDANLFSATLQVRYYNTRADALLQKNLISNLFTNTIPNQQVVYARVFDGLNCAGIIKITLNVLSFSSNNFKDETKYICPNKTLKLEVQSGFDYDWSNGNTLTNSIIVNSTGIYTVKITNNNCSIIKTFKVLDADLATINSIDVNDFNETGNSILVNYSGTGAYEFSINGADFQDSNLFNNVPIGEYFVTIRDKYKCEDVVSNKIYVLDYPKFFSPNNDGVNDYWSVKNLNKSSVLMIFDRFGKLLKQFNATDFGWDGNLDGQQLPADDYWFIINIDNKRTIKNHFALKR